MTSLVYNSFLDDLCKGSIDMDTDTFYVMLVTNAYTPDKDAHTKRSDVTHEVSGTGYTSPGTQSVVSLTKDTTNDREDVSFGNVSWSTATITARAAVIYKHRGGADTADELVAYIDFGADVSSTAASFAVSFSSPLRFQN